MISEGDILLFRFPYSDLSRGKLRPALAIKRIVGDFDDWLVCMISTQTRHKVDGLELILSPSGKTGLKKESLVRTSRLAVVESGIFEGKLGALDDETFSIVRKLLADWIQE